MHPVLRVARENEMTRCYLTVKRGGGGGEEEKNKGEGGARRAYHLQERPNTSNRRAS